MSLQGSPPVISDFLWLEIFHGLALANFSNLLVHCKWHPYSLALKWQGLHEMVFGKALFCLESCSSVLSSYPICSHLDAGCVSLSIFIIYLSEYSKEPPAHQWVPIPSSWAVTLRDLANHTSHKTHPSFTRHTSKLLMHY